MRGRVSSRFSGYWQIRPGEKLDGLYYGQQMAQAAVCFVPGTREPGEADLPGHLS
jgi:hypothetical protein